ncbi:MAG: CpsD/CapB family tyrosine-protein kinase [Candidatus Omnitrophota bacterium]
MGKISDALKKIEQERSRRKQSREGLPPLDMLGQPAFRGAAGTTPKDRQNTQIASAVASISEKIDILKMDSFYATADKDASGIDPRIVTYYDYFSSVSEQYRVLRTNIKTILFKNNKSQSDLKKINKDAKTLTITSSLPSEGKTITCINLAVALAKDIDCKVLILDCDLRKGSIHKLLNIDPEYGITDVLSDETIMPEEAILPTNIPNLFVVSAGKTSERPSELLGSNKMRRLIENLKDSGFSYILLDTPPLIPFADAGVVGAFTDGVILAIQAYRTQKKVTERAIERLERAHAKLLGLVLTQSDYYVPDIYSYKYYYSRAKEKSQKEEPVTV